MSIKADVLKSAARVAANLSGSQVELTFLVDEARQHGASWREIGDALGLDRRTVWEKYSGKRVRVRRERTDGFPSADEEEP